MELFKFYLKTIIKFLQGVAFVLCLQIIRTDLLIIKYGMLLITREAVVISQP